MNQVFLTAVRLVRDPDVKIGTGDKKSYALFTVACDRGKDRNGRDLGADFVACRAFGKTAENMNRYLGKGSMVNVVGRWVTGSYENKDGHKVYTNECYADRVEFVGNRTDTERLEQEKQDRSDAKSVNDAVEGTSFNNNQPYSRNQSNNNASSYNDNPFGIDGGTPSGFTQLTDDDIPF